jgi:short-subunit dehydrogenase
MKVFITGASSGIGAALAQVYAAQGAECWLLSRRIDALQSLRFGLVGVDRHHIHAVDVNDARALAGVAQLCIDEGGVPDVVIANAGISGGTDTADPEDLDAFRRIIETNVVATVATFSPFIAAMKAAPKIAGGRRLVGIGSVAGVRGLPGAGAYSASKAAVMAFAESLRIELRGSGIDVVTIAPGFIDTPMTAANPYPMPFLMPVDAFAKRAVRAIAAGRSYTVIPWQMGWLARLMRVLPNALFDRALAGRARKPRLEERA